MTAGLAALGRHAHAEIFAQLRTFSAFEREMTRMASTISAPCQLPQENNYFGRSIISPTKPWRTALRLPNDPMRLFRCITVMLAAEY
jgi:hypothetical protein